MKKRLLITSIVMMLVVAVALSTATYAWFTSNTSVSASVMTLRAATNDNDALGIGWTGHGAESFLHVDMNNVLSPMAPKDLEGSTVRALANGTSIYEVSDGSNPTGIQFYTSTVKQDTGDVKFNNNGAVQVPVIYQHAATGFTDGVNGTAATSFYVTNLSPANTVDTIKVYGVFSEIDNDKNKYVITDKTVPGEGTYYTKTAEKTFAVVPAADLTSGFDATKTYYEKVTFYVETADTTVQPNVDYYTYNGSKYTKVESGLTVNSAFPTITNADPAQTKYYELHDESGDDMIRIALYKKEYRYAKDSTTQSTLIDSGVDQGKHQTTASGKYYRYEPNANGANILKQVNLTTGTIIENLDYTLYCLDSDDHILFGILGQNDTEFTAVPEGEDCDRTKVYYTASGTLVTADDDFAAKKKEGLYTLDDGVYSLVTTDVTFAADTYYTVNFTQALSGGHAITTFANSTVYYTAKNTVANGEITQDKKVNDLYYYSDVKAEMEFTNLKPGEQIDFVAVVWLDGTALDDTRAGNYAQVSLKFDALK